MAERLSDPRIQTFLATKDVVVLATVEADGTPLLTPMWFVHDPDALTMVSLAHHRKVWNLQRDPRAAVVAEAGTHGDIRGVTVEGDAEFLEESTERRALLARYHPAPGTPVGRSRHAAPPRDVPDRAATGPELGAPVAVSSEAQGPGGDA